MAVAKINVLLAELSCGECNDEAIPFTCGEGDCHGLRPRNDTAMANRTKYLALAIRIKKTGKRGLRGSKESMEKDVSLLHKKEPAKPPAHFS